MLNESEFNEEFPDGYVDDLYEKISRENLNWYYINIIGENNKFVTEYSVKCLAQNEIEATKYFYMKNTILSHLWMYTMIGYRAT